MECLLVFSCALRINAAFFWFSVRRQVMTRYVRVKRQIELRIVSLKIGNACHVSSQCSRNPYKAEMCKKPPPPPPPPMRYTLLQGRRRWTFTTNRHILFTIPKVGLKPRKTVTAFDPHIFERCKPRFRYPNLHWPWYTDYKHYLRSCIWNVQVKKNRAGCKQRNRLQFSRTFVPDRVAPFEFEPRLDRPV